MGEEQIVDAYDTALKTSHPIPNRGYVDPSKATLLTKIARMKQMES